VPKIVRIGQFFTELFKKYKMARFLRHGANTTRVTELYLAKKSVTTRPFCWIY